MTKKRELIVGETDMGLIVGETDMGQSPISPVLVDAGIVPIPESHVDAGIVPNPESRVKNETIHIHASMLTEVQTPQRGDSPTMPLWIQ